MSHPILELQAADTLADQLRHRRSHLPEQAQIDAAHAELVEWERRRNGLQRRLDELDAAIARSEAESHAIDTQRARLDKQLKTVIAPREAEALMHEITLLNERRGELDDAELQALEEQSQVDDDLTALRTDEATVRSAVAAADELGETATAAIDAQLAEIASRLDALRAAVDPALLGVYDGLRGHHMVAAAALTHGRCDGCYMDLSATEIDQVRAAARDGLSECPHCGRLLVV